MMKKENKWWRFQYWHAKYGIMTLWSFKLENKKLWALSQLSHITSDICFPSIRMDLVPSLAGALEINDFF